MSQDLHTSPQYTVIHMKLFYLKIFCCANYVMESLMYNIGTGVTERYQKFYNFQAFKYISILSYLALVFFLISCIFFKIINIIIELKKKQVYVICYYNVAKKSRTSDRKTRCPWKHWKSELYNSYTTLPSSVQKKENYMVPLNQFWGLLNGPWSQGGLQVWLVPYHLVRSTNCKSV